MKKKLGQEWKVKSESEVTQSCPTLSNPNLGQPNQQWLVWGRGSFLQIQKQKKAKIHHREMSKN